MIARIKIAYRNLTAHLYKVLGSIGFAVMTVDPQAVWSAATTYLGANPQKRIGQGLFALVILRGWYTGRKVKALQAQLDALKAGQVPPPT